MLVWVIFAAMTAVAAILVLRPLLGGDGDSARPGRDDYAAAVYRDQLASLDAEVESGVLASTEAEAARTEIARRLLSVGETSRRNPSDRPALVAAIGVALFVPLASLGLYGALGSPGLPAQPAAARLAPENLENQSVDQLLARVERHLAENPTDVRGWEVIGPPLMRLGRFSEAARAFRQTIALDGATAERLGALGEALTLDASGVVGAEARKAFEQAVELDPKSPLPRFYIGEAAAQDGDRDRARRIWTDLMGSAPAGAPWRANVAARLAKLDAGDEAPGPDADMVAAEEMTAEDRGAMISGMVARLDTRLAEEGGSPEEWLRLVNAYRVLGDTEKRTAAIARARAALSDDADALQQFESGIAGAGNAGTGNEGERRG